MTVSDAGNLWLQRASLEGLEESTIQQYQQHLRLHIEPLLGNQSLSKLSAPILEKFKDQLLRTRSRSLSRKVLTSLKGVCKEALRLGYARINVAGTVQISRKSRGMICVANTQSSSVRIPSKDDIRILIRKSEEMFPIDAEPACKGSGIRAGTCWHPLVIAAIFTGMRASELRGLSWDHVDLKNQIIRVRQRADFKGKLGPPKSGAGIRDIPMAPLVVNTLGAWRARCPNTALNIVFPSRNGRIHTNSNIRKQCWAPLQIAAGIMLPSPSGSDGQQRAQPRFNFHALRHAAASLFIEQGWQPKKVQAIMGHSSIQITFDTYGKLWKDPEADLAAMAELERRLFGEPKDQGNVTTVRSGTI